MTEWHYIDDTTDKQHDELLLTDLLTRVKSNAFAPGPDTLFWAEHLDEGQL